jgi:DNA-binding transcriptional LysR family regulator
VDTLVNLQAFIGAAETGSFSEAARQAGLAPSVIAKRIGQLEARIRAPLFMRSTRKLTLTDVGERYLPQLRQLARQMEDTLDGMAQASGELEGHIRIKIPTTMGVLYLSEMLNRFLQIQPRVSMDVLLADRSVNPDEEGFDIAIGARPESYGQVQDHPLCPIRRHLCAAPSYLARRGVLRSPTELLDHDCLVFATSGAHWDLHGPQGLVSVEVRPRMRSNDGTGLLAAALAGQGIAILSDYLVAPALRSGALKAVLPDMRLPDIWLKALVPNKRIDLPRIQTLLQWLQAQLGQTPPWSDSAASQAGQGQHPEFGHT